MRWSLALVLSGLLLSGCSGEPPAVASDTPSLEQAEAAAEDLAIQATETTGVIRGVVVDDTLKPLGGALVTLTGGANTTTSEEGAFGFEDLEPGTYFMVAALKGYTTVQQSVEVVAGIDVPESVRILLTKIPQATPFIETLSARAALTWSGWVDGVGGVTVSSLTGEGNYFISVEISENGTVAQTEAVWQETTALGEMMLAGGGTYNGDGGVSTDDWTGTSPLVMVANATEDGETADSIRYDFYAFSGGQGGALPVGIHLNQNIDVFINVFHNFLPNEGWTFTADGAHPVPE